MAGSGNGQPRAARAADPTATAKKAAAKVRRCAEELTAALREANGTGLRVNLSLQHGTLTDSNAIVLVDHAKEVCVRGAIEAQVSL